jgi:hypothetical protein
MLSFKRLVNHAIIAAAVCSSAAQASTILIGDALELESVALDGLFSGGDTGDFTNIELAIVHESILDSGIDTNAVISVLPVDTDNGLALMFLIDQPDGDGVNGLSAVSLTSTAPGSASFFINDPASDLAGHIESATGLQTTFGDFTWHSDGSGDAFAWGNLIEGDQMTMLFTAHSSAPSTFPGLNPTDNIQFLNWTGSDWAVAEVAEFNSGGTYAFTAMVLPAPGALALLALAGARTRRRRRTA